ETKDNRLATDRAPAVIAKFQQQIADARDEARGLCLRPREIPPRDRDSRDQPWRFWRAYDGQERSREPSASRYHSGHRSAVTRGYRGNLPGQTTCRTTRLSNRQQ